MASQAQQSVARAVTLPAALTPVRLLCQAKVHHGTSSRACAALIIHSRQGPARRLRARASLDAAGGASPDPEGVTRVTQERQQLFDDISPTYDLLNDVLSLGLHRVWKRMTVAWSGAAPGDTALDICCGSGDIALLLSDRVGPSGKVVGLDFAKEQLAMAKSKEEQTFRGFSSPIEWVWGDALSLPLESNSVDAVTMGYGLRNVADRRQSLQEIHRVLRPGRSCAILDFNNSEDKSVAEFQAFMLRNAVVPLATHLGLAAQYEYLEPSIRGYPHGQALEAMAKEVGFLKSVYYEIAFGLMGVLVSRK